MLVHQRVSFNLWITLRVCHGNSRRSSPPHRVAMRWWPRSHLPPGTWKEHEGSTSTLMQVHDASWCFMMLHGLWCCISFINFESVWIFLANIHWGVPLSTTLMYARTSFFIKSFPAAENIISSLTRLVQEETVMSAYVTEWRWDATRCKKTKGSGRPAPDWPRSRVGRPAAASCCQLTGKRVQFIGL